jgi:hypothetical protein
VTPRLSAAGKNENFVKKIFVKKSFVRIALDKSFEYKAGFGFTVL